MYKKHGSFAKNIVELALFSAIIFIVGLTPLGYIPIGLVQIVTVHIPVIIGSIVLGPKKGTFLGLVFGLTSFITAHMQPGPMSYFFSPFFSSNFLSLIVCFVPRILVGIVPYFIYKLFNKLTKNKNISLIVSGMAGSLINTVFVMGFIYLFFAKEYSEVIGTDINSLLKVIFMSTGLNAIIEAVFASILTLGICKVILKLRKG